MMAIQQETQLLIDWQTTQDPDVGNELVERYLPLVDYVTHRMILQLPKTADKDEIKSLAFEGLLDAFSKFETTHATKFETYAIWRIKGSILDGLRKLDWLPRGIREQVKKIDQAVILLQQQLQREATDEEVAEHLDMHVAEVKRIVRHSSLAVVSSIHQESFHEATIDSEGFLQSPINPEFQVERAVLLSQIEEAIHLLPEREKLVVSLAYQDELKFTEIAEILEVSVSRISQLHSKAMSKIRRALIDSL